MSVVTLYALNLVDLLCTLYALYFGAQELNPLMQSLPIMIFYKVVVVGGLCWVLHHFAEGGNKAARWGLSICAAVYTALCIYHFYGLLMIGGMIC